MSKNIENKTSLNNRLILEVYVPKALEKTVNMGFASVSQAVQVKGLKVLVDALLADGTQIKAGSTAYIKEKTLHTHAQFKEIYESDGVSGKFIIANANDVEFVVP